MPIWEPGGHAAAAVEGMTTPDLTSLMPNCALLHAARPFAAEGDATVPAGSVTVAFLRSGVASVCGLSLWGTDRLTAYPAGASASAVSGET